MLKALSFACAACSASSSPGSLDAGGNSSSLADAASAGGQADGQGGMDGSLPDSTGGSEAGACSADATKTVASGQTWQLQATTKLCGLTIESGGSVAAPDGYSITMTVDGVESGQALTTTSGVATAFVSGTYIGNVVLTLTTTTPVAYAAAGGGTLTFPFRQALYLGASGVETDKSVLAAVTYAAPTAFELDAIAVTSTGEAFDAVYAVGGTYTLNQPTISLTGNGRSDFAGYGTAIVADGTSTKLVIDGAIISNKGVVRNAIVSNDGANVVVKNSTITTQSSTLPADYVQTVNTGQMRSVPWMLGIRGTDNVRATNLLGTSSKGTYVNSTITSNGWGVLSTDSGSGCTLTAINSTIDTKDTDGNVTEGYGSYAIGDATEYFLGTTFNVGSYATINTGGVVNFGDSAASMVASLNSSLGIGLSGDELAKLTPTNAIVNSKRFGIMWHSSSGTVNIAGGTVFNTGEAVFLPKTTGTVSINIDGSEGAALKPVNGVILQVMDDDDPGPVNSMNTGTYTQPTTTPSAASGFDPTSTSTSKLAKITLSAMALTGDFYNGAGWGVAGAAENMAVYLASKTTIAGTITSSKALHYDPSTGNAVTTITAANYYDLGEVKNTPQAAINNGTIVSVDGTSTWVVTGTSYLTKLVLASGAILSAPTGKTVTMTVAGAATPVNAGTYSGAIVLTVQ